MRVPVSPELYQQNRQLFYLCQWNINENYICLAHLHFMTQIKWLPICLKTIWISSTSLFKKKKKERLTPIEGNIFKGTCLISDRIKTGSIIYWTWILDSLYHIILSLLVSQITTWSYTAPVCSLHIRIISSIFPNGLQEEP